MNLTQTRDTIEMLYGRPLAAVSDCLRGFLIAREGYDLIGCDFSAIESRVLNWLAGEESVLRLYRGNGKIYEFNASGIYGVSIENVTAEQRQVGKVAELSFGFQGGVGAFQRMAKNYRVSVSDSVVDGFKRAWRAKHPNVVRYWYQLEEAAMAAIRNPGMKFTAGSIPSRQVAYLVKGSFLLCRLPSGRAICYPYPKIEVVDVKGDGSWMKESITYMGEGENRKWEKQKAYGGLLSENVTQAVARDLLAEALVRCEESGYPPVIHIHDEIVAEKKKGEGSVREMELIMSAVPSWAKDLPIEAKGFRAERYQK